MLPPKCVPGAFSFPLTQFHYKEHIKPNGPAVHRLPHFACYFVRLVGQLSKTIVQSLCANQDLLCFYLSS